MKYLNFTANAGLAATMKRSGSSSNNISDSRDSLVENLLAKIREGDIAPRSTKDYSSPFEGFQGLRRSRHFARTVMNDQSRERSGEQR
uniref:Uncharacterized protein n=2 Tax=Romanomermis culicivorax TaxID=13658 RepID=A0A915JG40_ROMCU